jgi:hypothetical protein
LAPTPEGCRRAVRVLGKIFARCSARDASGGLARSSSNTTSLSTIVPVRLRAVIGGALTLRYLLREVSEPAFNENWSTYFPWFADLCALDTAQPFTLRVKEPPQGESAISDFRYKFLFSDLTRRDDALWYDQVSIPDAPPFLSRMPAYLAAVSRTFG